MIGAEIADRNAVSQVIMLCRIGNRNREQTYSVVYIVEPTSVHPWRPRSINGLDDPDNR